MTPASAATETCLCRHSAAAHHPRAPRPCRFCSCAAFTDPSVSTTQSHEPLSSSAQRALDVLLANPAFQNIAADHLHAMARLGRRRLFLAGMRLIAQGDASTHLYVLAKGSVRVEHEEAGKRPTAVAVLGPGEVIGEMGILSGGARLASVVAVEDVETLEIGLDDLKRIFREDRVLMHAFVEIMHSRLHPRGYWP